MDEYGPLTVGLVRWAAGGGGGLPRMMAEPSIVHSEILLPRGSIVRVDLLVYVRLHVLPLQAPVSLSHSPCVVEVPPLYSRMAGSALLSDTPCPLPLAPNNLGNGVRDPVSWGF